MRALKYLAVVIGIFALVVLGGLIYVTQLDPEVYKPYVLDAVHEATGRRAHIDGVARVTVLPAPGIRLEQVRLANTSWASEPDMATLERLDLRLALWPLLNGEIRIAELVLVAPVVRLEVDETGRPNWALGPAKARPEQGRPFALSLASVSVRDAVVRYRDRRAAGTEMEFAVEEFTARERPAALAVRLRSSYRGERLHLDGTVGDLATLLADGPFPLDLQGSLGDVRIKARGAVRMRPDRRGFELALEANVDSLDALEGFTDTELPPVGPLRASLDLRGAPTAFEARDVDVTAGQSRATGSLKVDLRGRRPSVAGELSTPLLDLNELLPEAPEKTAETKPSGDRLFAADPLPFDRLPAWDMDVRLKAGGVRYRELTLEEVTLPVELRAGRLTISPEASLARGRFAGKLGVATDTQPPAVALQLEGREFEVGELSRQIRGVELTRGGKATLDIDVEGRGASVREIMAGLNGRVEFHQRESLVRAAMLDRAGGDIVSQLLRVIIPGGEKKEMTRLECAVARLGVRDGIAVADKTLAVQTAQVNVVGSGSINLRDETLDLGARLGARKGVQIGAGSLASLMRLHGSLANPQIGTDLTGMTLAGMRVAGAFFTGGLSLLAEQAYERLVKQPDPCGQALAAELPMPATAAAGSREGDDEPGATEQEKAPPKKPRKSLLKEFLGQ